MNKKIPLARPSIGNEELEAVKKVFESKILAQGPTAKEFEREFARYLGVRNAVATSSGTTALYLALLALGIGTGDEVIVPDFTFPATGNIVVHAGASPVLVDIEPKTYNIDPKKIEEAITKKTKAILPVHLFGQPADMKPLMEIAEKRDLRVVEDAACAIGALNHGRKAGTFGDVACFSFHPRKILSTGEGGMLVTGEDELAEKAYALKDHGKKLVSSGEPFFYAGYNFRMSDVLAAIGLAQLRKVDKMIDGRIRLARRYTKLLGDVEGIRVPYVMDDVKHVYQTYCLMVRREGVRDKLIAELAKRGVETQVGTYALHLQPYYKGRKDLIRMKLAASEKAYRNTLALPLYNDMTREEQDYVCINLIDLMRSF